MPRITDLLKTPEPETQTIKQDGKTYKFTPGKNGSLIVEGEKVNGPFEKADFDPGPQTGKVIGPDDDKQTSVGSTRG